MGDVAETPQAPAKDGEVPAARGRGGGRWRGARGKGGNRGNRGGQGGGQQGQQQQQQAPHPKQLPDPPKTLDAILAPKALGGKPTAAKNDPLMDSCLTLPGVSGFVEKKRDSEFELDFSQYMTLVEEAYISQITCDRGLTKFVPQSAFVYYMVLALWKRLYQIVSHRFGIDTYEKINGVIPEMYVTKEIKLYLDGIGNITDAGMKTWYFRISQELFVDQPHYGAQGSFGRVNDATHIRYETMPAPIVAMLTMVADVLYTVHNAQKVWALPDDMTPADINVAQPAGRDGNPVPPLQVASGNPTTNLLGYRPARKISNDHAIMLDDNGVSVGADWNATQFDVRNVDRIPILVSLVNFLTGQFKCSKCPMYQYTTDSIIGSLAQVPYTKRDITDVAPESGLRAVAKNGITSSYRQTLSNVTVGAIMFRYRFKRVRNDTTSDSYCYFWKQGNVYHIPPGWRANELSVYDISAKWNIDDFTSGSQDGRGVLNELCMKTKKKQER